MATNEVMELPEGFVIDQSTESSLPEGFSLDGVSKKETFISKAPETGFLTKLSNIITQKEQRDASNNAYAQNAYAISKVADIPLDEVIAKDLVGDPSVTGMQKSPNYAQVLAAATAPIGFGSVIAGLATTPVPTLVGMGASTGVFLGLESLFPKEKFYPKNADRQTIENVEAADLAIKTLLSLGAYKATSDLTKNVLPRMGLGKYAQNKTLAIRENAKVFYKDLQTKYGQDLQSLSTDPNKVNPEKMLYEMEAILNERRPMDATGKRIPAPSTADSALSKSYERLMTKWGNSKDGNLKVGDLIQELQLIKNAGGVSDKPSMKSGIANLFQKRLLGAIKDDINSPKFSKMLADYSMGMQKLEAADAHLDIWERNPYLTAKGEKFLTRGIYQTEEAKGVAGLVEKEFGQSLKGAKAASFTHKIAGNKLLRGLLAIYGIRKGVSGVGK